MYPQVMSDATPDPIIPGEQYAQTRIEFGPNALSGISTIDNTTKILAGTLATVVDILPNGSGPLYGIAVHTAFATAVRAQGFPGIASSDVETTFSLAKTFRYGSKGSIRTDVVLRNDIGDIIAIYDVKTGGAKITRERAEELRAKTRADSNVPIIELNLNRGVMLKRAASIIVCRAALSFRFRGVSHVHGN